MKTMKTIAGFGLAAMLTLAQAGTHAAKAEPLNVGSTPTGVPFTFLDIESNSIQGMMVDLIEAVGKEAGFEPNVQAVQFSSLIPALTSGKIDVISAAMLITPTRQEVIDFSDPVLPYGEGLVVATDSDISSLDELQGEAIGVQQGTVYLEGLREIGGFGDIRIYDSLADILRDVELGRITAGIGDKPIIAYQLSQGQYPDVKLSEDYESRFVGSVGIGVRKDSDELLTRINDALAVLKERGEIDALAEKWGLQ